MNFATYINEAQGGFAKRSWAIVVTAPEDGATWKKGQDYYYGGYDHANQIPILMDKPSKNRPQINHTSIQLPLKNQCGKLSLKNGRPVDRVVPAKGPSAIQESWRGGKES